MESFIYNEYNTDFVDVNKGVAVLFRKLNFMININMRTPYTEFQLKDIKSIKTIPCECYTCNNIFYIKRGIALRHFNKSRSQANKYCSKKCQNIAQITSKEVVCKECNIKFIKNNSEVKKFPNHFCNSSCAATYNNTHKTKGNRKSKLEFYLEKELPLMYPGLEFHFNRKDAINSELDVYIPSMKLAFELNGIFHYEPIYGDVKLEQIKNNDKRKFQACLERGIELCIIDASQLKYFKESNARPYLEIIKNIINNKS